MSLLPMLLLCAAPSVSGSVVDTAGDPVAGATVELRDKLVEELHLTIVVDVGIDELGCLGGEGRGECEK